jgi:predicted Ser/Thr protein kinase
MNSYSYCPNESEVSRGIDPSIHSPTICSYLPRNRWKGKVKFENGWLEKSFDQKPLPESLFGRISLQWEELALKRLKGIEGVPKFLGRPTRHSIRMTRLPGVPLDTLKKGEMSESCFQRLQNLVHLMHRRGVAHGDLHMRNILIHQQTPSIIDFATSYVLGRLPVLDRQVFRLFVLLDLERLYKVEKKYFGKGNPPRMFYLYRLVKAMK